jgi:hypothetical protein
MPKYLKKEITCEYCLMRFGFTPQELFSEDPDEEEIFDSKLIECPFCGEINEVLNLEEYGIFSLGDPEDPEDSEDADDIDRRGDSFEDLAEA